MELQEITNCLQDYSSCGQIGRMPTLKMQSHTSPQMLTLKVLYVLNAYQIRMLKHATAIHGDVILFVHVLQQLNAHQHQSIRHLIKVLSTLP